MDIKRESVIVRNEESIDTGFKTRFMHGLGGKYRNVPVIFALILIIAAFSIVEPTYLSARNINNLSIQIVNITIGGLGLFMVILVGKIDLSIASMAVACTTIAATLNVIWGWNIVISVAIALLSGCFFGCMHGLIITKTKMPAFIVTLAASMIYNGLILLILPTTMQISISGTPIEVITAFFLPPVWSYLIVVIFACIIFLLSFQRFWQAKRYNPECSLFKMAIMPFIITVAICSFMVFVFNLHRGLNLAVLIMFVLIAAIHYLLTQTKLGVHMYAIGGNEDAVRRTGINVDKRIIINFMIAGSIFAFNGLVLASRVRSVSAESVSPDLMGNAVAAAVLGGASLRGGVGRPVGVLIGGLIIGSMINGLHLIGASQAVRSIAIGTIVIIAIFFDSVIIKLSKADR